MSDKWKTRAKEAEAALQSLRERLDNPELVVDEMHYSSRDGTDHGEVAYHEAGEPWATRVMAASFARTFKDAGATNYVEMSWNYQDPETDEHIPLLVTIQRRFKPTPHKLRERAEAEVKRLVALLAQVGEEASTRPEGMSTELAAQVETAILRNTPN